MPPRDSLYPQDWFRIGEKDLKRAEHLLSIDDPEGAGYHLHNSQSRNILKVSCCTKVGSSSEFMI